MTEKLPPAPHPTRRRRWLTIVAAGGEIALVMIALGLVVLFCSIPATGSLASRNPTTTAFIELRRAEAADANRKFELKWQWRPIGRISRYLRAAVIYAEDYRFYEHDGVDWSALRHAASTNFDSGTLKIGGSTITQQLAKNLYLSPDRSVIRKARELLIAFALEDHLSKQRILELYLNVVEWGDGVFGAEAAAHRWFGHSAQWLAPAEAARLAIALPNPRTRAPNVHTAELTKKAVRIIRMFRIDGLIDEAQERQALDAVGAKYEKTVPDPARPAPPSTEPPTEPASEPDTTVPSAKSTGSAQPASSPETAGSDTAGSAESP